MAKDMFGDIVEPSIKVGSQKWYTVPLSIIVHTAIIGAVVIIPLMAADVLPTAKEYGMVDHVMTSQRPSLTAVAAGGLPAAK